MSPTTRWLALAALLALAGGATAVALTAGDDEANGGTTARSARWIGLHPSPLERTEIGAARVGRQIYAIGGSLAPDVVSTGQVARYDTKSGAWTLVAPIPLAVNHPAAAPGAGRCRGEIYVYGGYSFEGNALAEVDALQRYDPRTDSWTALPGSGVKRAAATLVPVGCSLYAIGGTSGAKAQRLVQVYDIRRGAWRPGPSMRVAREHLAGVAIGRRILVLGGRDSGHNLDVVEELDTRGGKWRHRPPIPTPRSGFGAAAIRGWAIAVGGEELAEGTDTIRAVEAFDPVSRKWRKLPGMLTPRHGLGVVALGSRLVAVEGGPQPGGSYSAALEMLRVPRRLLPATGRRFRDDSAG